MSTRTLVITLLARYAQTLITHETQEQRLLPPEEQLQILEIQLLQETITLSEAIAIELIREVIIPLHHVAAVLRSEVLVVAVVLAEAQ